MSVVFRLAVHCVEERGHEKGVNRDRKKRPGETRQVTDRLDFARAGGS